MDPDLVRQQAEEEAASRIHSRRGMPPDVRIEPILPMPAAMSVSRPQPLRKRPASLYQSGAQAAVAVASAGWRMAFGIAASCVLGTTVGLVGGMMLGVKLQLVPWQGALIGASAGLLLGWRLGSLALIKRRALGRMQAYGAAFRAALMIFLIMAAAMFVAPHFTGAIAEPNQPLDAALFWRAVAGGALIALLFGAAILRRAFADAAFNRINGDLR
jgi:Domain of unknown function (DUF4396)